MNALDQLRTTHRRVQVADQLEQAARNLCDILAGDELEGERLYDAIETAKDALADALDTYQRPPGIRLAPPPDPTPERTDNDRLCALREVPISRCTCTACTARRDGLAQRPPEAPEVSDQDEDTDQAPAQQDDPDPHAGEAEPRTCRSCEQTKPLDDYSMAGGGRLWTCRDCMSAKKSEGLAKRKAKKAGRRDSSDDKEPV